MADPKPVRWYGPSLDELSAFPWDVKRQIGFRLRRVQNGEHVRDGSVKRFGEDNRIAHLTKIVCDGDDGNTYRTAITVEFEEGIWVLAAFEKRSSSGIGTPKRDIDRIAERLKRLKEYRGTAKGAEAIASMVAEAAELRKQSEKKNGQGARKPKGQ
jgi:phage-related protein